MKKRIILISAKQAGGKTTTAKMVQKLAFSVGFEPILFKFADPLYEIHDLVWGKLEEYGLKRTKLIKGGYKIDGKLMQLLGTEWGRAMDKNLWVNIMREKINRNKEKLIIIDDARFVNEMRCVSRGLSLKVRLECDEEIRKGRAEKWREDTTHESEIALDDYPHFDLLFDTEKESPEDIAAKIIKEVRE